MKFYGFELKNSFRYLGLFLVAAMSFFTTTSLTISPDQTLMGVASIFEILSVDSDKTHDLGIIDYEIKKLSDPNAQNLNAVYSLRATVVNNSDDFENEQVVLSVDPLNKNLVLAQKNGHFGLENEKKHVIEEIVNIPFYVAEQKLSLSLNPLSFNESNFDDNVVTFDIQQDYTGLQNIAIDAIDEAGNVTMDWYLPEQNLSDLTYSLLRYKSATMPGEELQFKSVADSYYGYGVAKFSQSLIKKYSFSEDVIFDKDKSFKLDEDPFFTENYNIVIVKAVNSETDAVMYSDAVYMSPQNLLNRGMLAQQTVKDLDLPASSSALVFFDDIDESSEYYHAVRAMYAAGYIEEATRFNPSALATRRDVAKTMSLVFDIPLVANQQFIDVTSEDSAFYSINALKSIVPTLKSQDKFLPDEPATSDWLKNLIKVLSEKYELS